MTYGRQHGEHRHRRNRPCTYPNYGKPLASETDRLNFGARELVILPKLEGKCDQCDGGGRRWWGERFCACVLTFPDGEGNPASGGGSKTRTITETIIAMERKLKIHWNIPIVDNESSNFLYSIETSEISEVVRTGMRDGGEEATETTQGAEVAGTLPSMVND